MAGIFARIQRSKSRRASIRRSRAHFVERLEERAYLAAVSITGPAEVDETAATSQFVVSLSSPVAAPVTVSYSLQSTAATATYGRDYRLFLGRSQVRPTGTLTFRPGQTSQVITMRTVNDNLREGDERFAFTLQAARNATVDPQARSLGITIKDDDAYTVSVVGPAVVPDGTTIEYQLQLSSPATRRETFYVSTRDGTGRVTQDYRPLTRVPVTILPGNSSAMVRVVTVANAAPDYDRILFLDVVPATPGFPAPAAFPVTIPGPLGPIPPSISVADVSVVEGAPATSTVANFVVTLTTPSTAPISVNYATADGTATTADNDYVAATGTLNFAPGETSKIVSVTVIGDSNSENDQTFQLVLSSPVNVLLERATGVGTIVNDDAPPEPEFKIVVVFPDDSLTNRQKDVFLEAAARWSEIIVGDIPDVSYQGRVIDDLEIEATAPAIDGAGGILGQAGPREFRNGSALPYLGIMQFDSADVARMVSEGTFTDVILHEMGHVLGLGTLWDFKNLVQGIGTTNPTYVGANAVREYQTLSGTQATSVPVENTGGGGTAGGHWRESVFNTEIMTGYAEAPGVPMPISRMTVGALEDLGYTVDYAAADPYSLNVRQAELDFRRSQLQPRTGSTRAMMLLTSGVPSVPSLFAAALPGISASTATETVTSKTFRAIGSAIRV
jgi:hypothetical protein